jgi:hypothetical protein
MSNAQNIVTFGLLLGDDAGPEIIESVCAITKNALNSQGLTVGRRRLAFRRRSSPPLALHCLTASLKRSRPWPPGYSDLAHGISTRAHPSTGGGYHTQSEGAVTDHRPVLGWRTGGRPRDRQVSVRAEHIDALEQRWCGVILSDLAGQLSGSLDTAPSSNISQAQVMASPLAEPLPTSLKANWQTRLRCFCA